MRLLRLTPLCLAGLLTACGSMLGPPIGPGPYSNADGSRGYTGRFDAASSDAGARPVPPPVVPPPPAVVPDAGTDAAVSMCDQIPTHDPVTLYLSSDDSNSVASPAIARRMIRQGQRVAGNVLRTYEFLNYYNVRYQPAEPGTIRLVPQMRPGDEGGQLVMQVGIQSETRTTAQIRPMSLTLVLDTSGSMGGGGRIERERAVVRSIAASLRAGDVVSALTWNTARTVVLEGHVVTGPNDPAIVDLARSLAADGGTDLHSGLVRGYELAHAHYRADGLNRMIVISDGEANVGETDADTIALAAHDAEREEIYLVGVGVGDGFNDTMMNTITDRGRGAYIFIDSDAEAARMFGERFAENVDLAARAVRLEITLPWYLRVVEFSGEAISTDPRVVDPQHLAPNDAMVFHQVLSACSATALDATDPVRIRATYESRDGRVPGDVVIDTTFAELLGGRTDELRRGDAIVAYAEALESIAAHPDDSAAARPALQEALSLVEAVPGAATDPDLQEIAGLIRQYATQF